MATLSRIVLPSTRSPIGAGALVMGEFARGTDGALLLGLHDSGDKHRRTAAVIISSPYLNSGDTYPEGATVEVELLPKGTVITITI